MATAVKNVENIYSYLFLSVAKIDRILLYDTTLFHGICIHERINIPSAFKYK